MSDFVAQIRAVLDTSQAEAQLKALQKNQKIKLNVELTGNGGDLSKILNNQISGVATNAVKAGQSVSKGFNQGIKSVKFNGFYKDYFKQIEKDTKKANDLVAKYQNKSFAPTQSQALKAVRAKQSAETKATNDYLKGLEAQQKQIDSYIKKYELGNYKAQQASMQSQLKKYEGFDSKSLASAKQFASEFKDIQSTLSKHFDGTAKLSPDKLLSYFNKAEDAAKKFKNEMKTVASDAVKPFNSLEAVTASNKTLNYLNNNSKAVKKYGDAFRELAANQRAATSSKELDEYAVRYRNLVSTVQKEGLTGRSFFDELKRGFTQIGQFVGTYVILQKAVQTVKQMAKAVLDVDSAMISLRKVSDASDLQLDTYFIEATESAKKYGATISDVVNSAADWSRLGYSLQDSKKLADVTTLYQRVGDNMTQESASSSLVSTLQGFKLTAEEAEHVVNAFNEVGNNFAIGSNGIGEALQRSASSMMAAGNTMEETIGLVTAANEVVQDPDRVGNGFKTKFSKNCLYVQKCA